MTRVLVVDDEPPIVRAVAANLRVRGFEVLTASTGETALAAVETHQPDCVVLDLGLPGIDGLETTQRFVALCPHAGVVILTAFDDARSMAEAVRAGARAYVLKTASGDEILETVRMVAGPGPEIWRRCDVTS